MEEFITINKNSEIEYIKLKSEFIANIFYVEKEEDVKTRLLEIKHKYSDARHNCYAYRINGKNILSKVSDDGEPTGTGGMPILNVIVQNNLENVLIIVTRYFGGILLGAGGLIRAYSKSAVDVVSSVEKITYEKGYLVEIKIDYSNLESLKYYFSNNNIDMISFDYETNVKIKILIGKENYKELENSKNNKKILNIKILKETIVKKHL